VFGKKRSGNTSTRKPHGRRSPKILQYPEGAIGKKEKGVLGDTKRAGKKQE